MAMFGLKSALVSDLSLPSWRLSALSLWLLATLALATQTALGQGDDVKVTCTPDGPSLDELVFKSQVVVYGKVVEQYANSKMPRTYTAELEVYCVYKGGPVPHKIKVYDAGRKEGECYRTFFNVSSMVLAYLRRHEDGGFSPIYKESPGGYKDEVFVNCGISIEYPIGLSADRAPYNCTKDEDFIYDENNCLTFKPENASADEGEKHADQHGSPGDEEDDNTGAAQGEGGTGGSASLRMPLTFSFLSLLVVVLFMS